MLVVLAGLFVILGTGAAYFLVRGLREGRIALRLTFPYPKLPLPDGREPGYAYRNHDPATFWVEIGVQALAVVACIVTFCILISAL